MRNRLHILLAIAMCLLMFCAACGKDTTADNNNTDTPPDIGGDSTPPDTTGDDKQEQSGSGDDTPVYTPIPDDPNKTYTGYTLDIPAAASAMVKAENKSILSLYSAFLDYYSTATACNLQTNQEITYAKLQRGGHTGHFSVVDFGLDGKLELVLYYSTGSCQVLFCEGDKLYTIGVSSSRMLSLKYNGICRTIEGDTESYELVQFNSRDGRTSQTLASVKEDTGKGEQYYFIYADFKDGQFVSQDPRQVSKSEFDAFVAPLDGLPDMKRRELTSAWLTDAFTTSSDDVPNPIINRDLAFAKKEPTDDEKQANRDTLKRYSRFLGDTWYAIELETGEKGSFYELERLRRYDIDYTALVDFGLDGVFEMVIVPKASTEPVLVVFYENGEVYVSYIDCNELQLLTYDGLCKNSSGGVDRLTFSAQNGCARQPIISVATDSANKTTYYSHADSREITKAEYDGFMTEQTYPVYYDNESRYKPLAVKSTADPLPDEATIDANREVLQIYYDFISGACTALEYGEQVMFDSITRYGTNCPKTFSLVDFGSDGVLEMVLDDSGYYYYTVLYCMDGQLYASNYSYRTMVGGASYNGITTGSGGSAGSDYMIFLGPDGYREWTIRSYSLDREIYKDRYYIHAAYENGKLVPAETVEVDKYTYYSFLENEPGAYRHNFNDETLKKVLRVDGVTNPVAPPTQDEDIPVDTDALNTQAMQAYYEWLTGARGAMSKSNHNNITYHSTARQYSRFAFADFGSDGVLELLLGFDTSDTYHIVLYYDNGNLYIDSLDCEWLKVNGYYEEETNWGGVRLLHHYVKRFAPSKGEYTIELGYETPPSKDSPNPVYRLYYTVVDGEYVLYTGESSKDALYSVLKEQFDTPDVKWLSFDTVFEHEFFAGVTGNN